MKNLVLMLAGIAFISISVLAAPQGQGSKRPHRGDNKKQDKRVQKKVGEAGRYFGCPKCAALEKRLSEMRKRIAGAKKGHARTGRRGRTDNSRGSRRGYRGKSGKGNTAPKHPMGSERLKKFVEMYKKRGMSEKGRRMPSKKRGGETGGRPFVAPANAHRRYNSTRS